MSTYTEYDSSGYPHKVRESKPAAHNQNDPSAPAAQPAVCSECKATSISDADLLCSTVECWCPMENYKVWPTQAEFDAEERRLEEIREVAAAQPSQPELKIGSPCPTCGRKILPKMGPGDYSCVSCGLGMEEPCEHWKKMLANPMEEEPADQPSDPRGAALKTKSVDAGGLKTSVEKQAWDSGEPSREQTFEKWCGITIIDESKAPKSAALKRAYKHAWDAGYDAATAQLRSSLEEARRENNRLVNAWMQDETIGITDGKDDGTVRPSIRKTIERAEKAESELASAREEIERLKK